MSTYSKKKVVEKIAEQARIHPDDVEKVIGCFFDLLTMGLSDHDRFEFRRFGSFSVVTRRQKIGQNLQKKNQQVIIPERRVVKFKPSTYLNSMANH